MNIRSSLVGSLTCLLLFLPAPAPASDGPVEDSVTVSAEYAYLPLVPEPRQKARPLALFGAKFRAAELGAKFLSRRGLLAHFGDRQKEILCLAAERIEPEILEENFAPETGEFVMRIRARIEALDFVRAENADLELEKKESRLSFREEMEQPVPPGISPGAALSRAYRYLRQKQWRIAIIYLDHLQRKYPGWSEVYLAKAIGYYSLNQTARMTDALEIACRLNNQEACDDMRGLGLVKVPGTP
ncbi:MAG: hypothetical protein PVG78_16110 [Desulfobacterales bacterium]|jgi:hypothetical protein